MPAYLDTSAFIKLVRSEPESHALRDELRSVETQLVSSVLLSVEGRRAARRYGTLASTRASVALTAITLLALDEPIIDIAANSTQWSCARSTRCTSRRSSALETTSNACTATTRALPALHEL